MNRRVPVKALALAATASLALGAAVSSASAEVVCNPQGECWHAHDRYAYPPGFVVHPDDWYFHRGWGRGPYRWRDYHPGRGYWRGGVWVPF